MSVGLVVTILGEAASLGAALDQGGAKVSAFGRSVDVGGIAKMAALGGGALLAANALVGFGNAAAQDQLEADQLATALTAAGAATGDWQAKVDAAIVAGEELAFTDTEIRQALTPLAGVTGDVGRATELMAIAQDVARLKGIDLATAANAVAKAEGGQATALAKLVGVNAKGLTSTQVLTAAQAKAAGQAKTYGDSTVAANEKMGIKFAELGEKIGTLVLPIMEALIPIVFEIIDAMTPLLDAILPPLMALFRTLATILGGVVRAIRPVIDVIATLAGVVSNAASTVANFVANLNPLKAAGDFIGGLFGGSIGGLAGTGPAGGAAPYTDARAFTVYASSADPDAVVRAIRRWAQLNGGPTAFARQLTG
jgi:hypothetical protein